MFSVLDFPSDKINIFLFLLLHSTFCGLFQSPVEKKNMVVQALRKINLINSAMRTMSTTENSLIIQEIRDKGLITINRPKSSNTVTTAMLKKLYCILKDWEMKMSLVVIRGAGDKFFCSGGDVKSIASDPKDKLSGVEFCRNLFKLSQLIGAYKIPYVAFIDGIVMGAGVNIALRGTFSVATERTLFALAEVQVGLVPEITGLNFLRTHQNLGLYLALTSHKLKGPDIVHLGIATHYCDSKSMDKLYAELINCSNPQNFESVLRKYHKENSHEHSLTHLINKINFCFASEKIEDIIVRLEKDGSNWAKDTIDELNKMPPTLLKVTLKQIRLGNGLSLEDCFQMDDNLAVSCYEHSDFYEGVRAFFIDKDQKPKWNPSTLSDVSDDWVDHFFHKKHQ